MPYYDLMTHKSRFHRLLFIALAIAAALPATVKAEATLELNAVDSLLNTYAQSPRAKKAEIGRQLIEIYTHYDAFLDEAPKLSATMAEDSLDLLVYFATDRFYVINAYYKEALDYNDRANRHGSRQQPDIHATLLCDRGYCLYKLSKMTEATEAEQQALRYSKQTGNIMQLSRAYLYLAIINYNVGTSNRQHAKDFIVKAIETNRQLGQNRQLHNTLGVACEIFCGAGEVEQAIDYGRQAVEAAEAIGYDAGVANHLSQLSYAYNRNRQYELGLEMAERAIKMVEAMPIIDRNLLAISMEYKGWNLLDMGRNAEAAAILRQAVDIEQEMGNMRAVRNDLKVVCEALEPIDPAGALQALKRHTALADSFYTVQLQEALGQANASFHNEELQAQNAQEHRLNRIILFGSIAAILLLAALAAALSWASLQKTRANRALRQLQKAREAFFTNVTHEFRTPLTVILGLSHELQKGGDQQATAAKAATIERQGGQLLNLVNQLLEISKVSSAIGKQPTQTADIAAYTEMAMEGFREVGRQHGIAVTFSASERPMVTDFEPDYLNKILNNLLGNALKFTPKGGEVSVRIARDKHRLHLIVADTGSGISPEDLPHIFDPFYQSDPDSGIGSGVGLTLVKQITEALRGKIEVESTKGKGTKFEVIVPIHKTSRRKNTKDLTPTDQNPTDQAPARPNGTLDASRTPPVSEGSIYSQEGHKKASEDSPQNIILPSLQGRGRGESLLIVEDNADVAAYISSLLEAKYTISRAADGREGLAMARELMPDLIVTDLMMPHTDGLELCRQIRADQLTNHIPIIVITAKATDDDRLHGIEAGADAYLYKPFRAEELIALTSNLLRQRQLLHDKYTRTFDAALHNDATESALPDAALDGALPDAAATDSGVRRAVPPRDSQSPLAAPASPTPAPTAPVSPAQAAAPLSSHPASERAAEEFVARTEAIVRSLMPAGKTDLESIASELCMTPSQLRRKLSAITGITPGQFVLSIRMAEACRLLLEHPSYSLASVAERCGFADQSHFSHAFRRQFGMTPSQWAAERGK